MGHGSTVGELRGPKARRLLAEAEREIARLRRRAEDDDRILTERTAERDAAIDAAAKATGRAEGAEHKIGILEERRAEDAGIIRDLSAAAACLSDMVAEYQAPKVPPEPVPAPEGPEDFAETDTSPVE